jgi:hypothetical protein
VETPVEIAFTASGTSGTLEYKYYQRSGYQSGTLGNWQQLRDWSTDNSLTWFPYSEGNYVVVAYVSDDPGNGAFHQAGLSIETSGNSPNPIQITEFSTTIDYPQSSGVAISLETTATGGTGPLYYRYWCRKLPGGQWTEIRGYDSTSSSTWAPAEEGLYTVVVWVSDTQSATEYSIAGMTCTIGE